ncbi:MAG: hypothetical protein V3S69_05405 [Dehalococcoidales bacterium]
MSVRYSPIAPLIILEQLQGQKLLGNYLLLLAHEVLKSPRGYIDLVEHMENTEENPRFIIMDNGVIERGSPVTAVELLEAANFAEADCIVTPDVIGDAPATRKLVMDQGSVIGREFPLMRIPQGACITDLFDCVDWLNESLPAHGSDPSYWGVPRWIANEMSTRANVINYINHECPKAKIHLLGMSKSLKDDQRCLRKPNVIGIDSANPIVMGIAGMEMRRGAWQHLDRGNLWDCQVLHPESADNVEFMHNALRS